MKSKKKSIVTWMLEIVACSFVMLALQKLYMNGGFWHEVAADFVVASMFWPTLTRARQIIDMFKEDDSDDVE